MGLYIRRRQLTKGKVIIALVAVFALIAIPTFIGVHTYQVQAEEAVQAARFTKSLRYVRANTPVNQHDIVTEIEFYKGTTHLALSVDDIGVPTEAIADPSTQTFDADGSSKIQVKIPLTPGPHTISGTSIVNGRTVDVMGGPQVVYALNSSTADYIIPTAGIQTFQPNANPVRIQIGDKFEQFKSLEFSLNTVQSDDRDSKEVGRFSLTRDQCYLTSDKSITCDMNRSPDWRALDEGTYFVKLKTSTMAETNQYSDGISFDNQMYWSLPFKIDKTAPAATIDGPLSVVGGESMTVRGTIEKAAIGGKLYIDGTLHGQVVLDGNGAWSYDLPTDLTLGNHRLSVQAEDSVGNKSYLEAATTTLMIRPFIPSKADIKTVNDAASGLTVPFIIPKEFNDRIVSPVVSEEDSSDAGVLGVKTTKDPNVDQNAVAAITSSNQGWKVFGIVWFWWLLMIALVTGAGSWALMTRRRYATQAI